MSDWVIPSSVWVEVAPGARVYQATGRTTMLNETVHAVSIDQSAAERECVQLRAERDQALTLLRAIRRLSEPQPNDSMNAHFSPVAKMIDASGLLDDEGQQP